MIDKNKINKEVIWNLYFFFLEREGILVGFPRNNSRGNILFDISIAFTKQEKEKKGNWKKYICSLLWQHSFLSYFLLVLRNIHHPFSHNECCTAKQCFIVFCFCCCLFISDMPVCLFICLFFRHFLHFYSQLLFRFHWVLFGRTNEWNFFRWRRNR